MSRRQSEPAETPPPKKGEGGGHWLAFLGPVVVALVFGYFQLKSAEVNRDAIIQAAKIANPGRPPDPKNPVRHGRGKTKR